MTLAIVATLILAVPLVVLVARNVRSRKRVIVLEQPSRPPPEPWRDDPRYDKAHVVPLEFLLAITSATVLNELQRFDGERLAWVQADVEENGLREGLTVVVDPFGRVALRDGHHRVIVAGNLDMSAVPVVVQQSERIRKSHAIPVQQALLALTGPLRPFAEQLVVDAA